MYKNKTFLAIVPARGGSKRLPRKNVLDLNGKPLIAWSIEAGLKSNYIDDMEIYKQYCKNETPVTHKLSKVGLNLPTYESLKSMDEIRQVLRGGI